jgi:16S rRNA (cytosine967-C5)-methyltransferase
MANNAIQFLKKGKQMLYITCSVFTKENEEVIERLQKAHNLNVVEMKYIEGYNDKADTMFVALLNA